MVVLIGTCFLLQQIREKSSNAFFFFPLSFSQNSVERVSQARYIGMKQLVSFFSFSFLNELQLLPTCSRSCLMHSMFRSVLENRQGRQIISSQLVGLFLDAWPRDLCGYGTMPRWVSELHNVIKVALNIFGVTSRAPLTLHA